MELIHDFERILTPSNVHLKESTHKYPYLNYYYRMILQSISNKSGVSTLVFARVKLEMLTHSFLTVEG